jgi:hypothetical protein
MSSAAQGAADQALDFQGATALLATAGFALVTLAGGARQHAVLGGQPAWPWPLRKRGTPFSTLTVQMTLVSPNSTSTDPRRAWCSCG